MIVCDDADLRRLPEAEQPGVDTVIEQEPFTEHGKVDSKLVVSLEDARAASIQGIPGVYWTEETTEILLGEFARPQEGGTPFHVYEVLGPHTYSDSGFLSAGNAYPGRQDTKQTS